MEVFGAVRTALAVRSVLAVRVRGQARPARRPPDAFVEATQQLARSCDTLPPHATGPYIFNTMKGDAK